MDKNPLLFWKPDKCPIKWAETPRDVPLIDRSRGVSPLLAYERFRALGSVTETKVLQSLGISPGEAPETGYPRLVAQPLTLKNWHGFAPALLVPPDTATRHEHDAVLNRLAGLWVYLEPDLERLKSKESKPDLDCERVTSRFCKQVLELAGDYGLIGDASVWAWVNACSRVSAHLFAMNQLQESKVLSSSKERVKQLADDLHTKQKKLAKLTEPYTFPVATRYGAFFHSEFSFIASVAGESKNERGFRDKISQALVRRFEATLKKSTFNLAGIYSHADLLEWSYWLLANAWAGERGVLRCNGCGQLFVPQRANQRFCQTKTSRCRKRLYDSRV